jgi:ribosome biogenesis GTPase A
MDAFERVLDLIVGRYGRESLFEYAGTSFENSEDLIDKFCRKRNFLARQGQYDTTRGAHTFLRDVASGKAGRFSFEDPDTFYQADPV